jgi:hypothetical protein
MYEGFRRAARKAVRIGRRSNSAGTAFESVGFRIGSSYGAISSQLKEYRFFPQPVCELTEHL